MTSTLGHEKKALKLKSSKNTGLISLEHNGLHLEVWHTQGPEVQVIHPQTRHQRKLQRRRTDSNVCRPHYFENNRSRLTLAGLDWSTNYLYSLLQYRSLLTQYSHTDILFIPLPPLSDQMMMKFLLKIAKALSWQPSCIFNKYPSIIKSLFFGSE